MARHWRVALIGMWLASMPAFATLAPEEMFQVEKIQNRQDRHIVVLADFAFPHAPDGRSHIIDTDTGEYLGVISAGYWHLGVMLPRSSNIIVSPEIYFSRGTRGERTDIIAFYDGETLEPLAETLIPPKRFTGLKMQGSSALSDDDRFAFVLNHTPAASVTVVDVENREFVTEVDIPGCLNIYATGSRSFSAICAHGGFMTVDLDDSGHVTDISRTDALFNAAEDPVTVSGVRVADTWYHVSQGGYVYGFRMGESGMSALPRWSLFSTDEREDDWRISGLQHLAIHRASGRAYVLVHQGGAETFEDPGTHVWVYDLKSGKRVEEIELERMALSIEVSQDSNAQLYALAVDFHIPQLFQVWIYLNEGSPALEKLMDLVLDVYEAGSGKLLRSVEQVGAFPSYIQVWPATTVEHADD